MKKVPTTGTGTPTLSPSGAGGGVAKPVSNAKNIHRVKGPAAGLNVANAGKKTL
jgi:hypothetical protein